MKNEKPLILISNDDGVSAKGLHELVKTLVGLGEIVVMAPDGPRSGASGSITSEFPVRYFKVSEEKDLLVCVPGKSSRRVVIGLPDLAAQQFYGQRCTFLSLFSALPPRVFISFSRASQ